METGEANLSQVSLKIKYTFCFREACVLFKAGKNHNGYFTSEDLLA